MNSDEIVKISVKSKSPTGRTQTLYDDARAVPFEGGVVFSLKSTKRDIDRKRIKIVNGDTLNTSHESYEICDVVNEREGLAIFAMQTVTNEKYCREVRIHTALSS